MDDKELLEFAARAAEIKVGYNSRIQEFYHDDVNHNSCGEVWNPLTDPSDALRLAVKLQITVDPYTGHATAIAKITRAT